MMDIEKDGVEFSDVEERNQCSRESDLIFDYVSRTLCAEQTGVVEGHLLMCVRCREAYCFLTEVARILRTHPKRFCSEMTTRDVDRPSGDDTIGVADG